jgi:hypothetical protein
VVTLGIALPVSAKNNVLLLTNTLVSRLILLSVVQAQPAAASTQLVHVIAALTG